MPTIQIRQLAKHFGATPALRGLDLDIAAGERVALVGPSGCGKSTLVHLLCGIERPSSGTIRIGEVALGALDEEALTRWRGRHVGLVFQSFELLAAMTALENVMLPMELARIWPRAEWRERALARLDQLGVADQAGKLPADMSGGQAQRVAIARALANDPPLILADEPSGNLDSANGERVLRLLGDLGGPNQTVIVVTHDPRHSAHFGRCVALLDGGLA